MFNFFKKYNIRNNMKKKYNISYVLDSLRNDKSLCSADIGYSYLEKVYTVSNGEAVITLRNNSLDETTTDLWDIIVRVGNDKIDFEYDDKQSSIKLLLNIMEKTKTSKYILSSLAGKTIEYIELDDSSDDCINIRTTTGEIFILQSIPGAYSSINAQSYKIASNILE